MPIFLGRKKNTFCFNLLDDQLQHGPHRPYFTNAIFRFSKWSKITNSHGAGNAPILRGILILPKGVSRCVGDSGRQ